jgi:hypothetical protein
MVRHTMSLINLESFYSLLRVAVFELVCLVLWRVPESRVVDWRNVEILSDALNPNRQSINSGP